METSKPAVPQAWQRSRVRCEPGQASRLKILPEPQTEIRHGHTNPPGEE
jgi:hypothetical protein